jgi:RNA polymerase sigma-70 factor (ECF subfamily)
MPGCNPFSLQDLPVGGDLAENLIERLSVQRALSRMPLSETEILLLVIVDGLSIQDAGRIVGISRFAVYRRLQSGKKHLKEELMKEGVGELSVRMRGGA